MNKIAESTRNKKKVIYKGPAVDTLHHLAFDNSSQANIIFTVSSGEIVTANMAACNLLGYSKAELLTKTSKGIFDENEDSFKTMLAQRKTNGESTALVTAVKKDSSNISCQITSASFIEKGIEKAITTIVDLSESILKQKNIDTKKDKIVAANIVIAQTKSDVRLAENNAWIKYIAKNSYDVMWDWDIITGEIYVGDSIEEVFGYKVENNMVNYKDFQVCLLNEEKVMIGKKLEDAFASASKSWNDSFTFKRYNKSMASTNSRASIVRDEDGKAIRMIGAIHDVTKLHELENKLEEQKGTASDTLPASGIVWDLNILTNEVCVGEGFENLLQYTKDINSAGITDWRNYLHPDDRNAVEKGLQSAIVSSYSHSEHTFRLIKSDGSTVKVFNRASIFRRANDTAYRIVGVIHDISPRNEEKSAGTELIENKKTQLIKNIKNVVYKLVHYSNEKLLTNFSDYLSAKLQYDYTYLANVFSEIEGVTIQQYAISLKIERAKELLAANEFSLAEIASKLQYSSVAHLCNQFKKITTLTPSKYKRSKLINSN
jgi:PAS domain S-box-containing protein